MVLVAVLWGTAPVGSHWLSGPLLNSDHSEGSPPGEVGCCHQGTSVGSLLHDTPTLIAMQTHHAAVTRPTGLLCTHLGDSLLEQPLGHVALLHVEFCKENQHFEVINSLLLT